MASNIHSHQHLMSPTLVSLNCLRCCTLTVHCNKSRDQARALLLFYRIDFYCATFCCSAVCCGQNCRYFWSHKCTKTNFFRGAPDHVGEFTALGRWLGDRCQCKANVCLYVCDIGGDVRTVYSSSDHSWTVRYSSTFLERSLYSRQNREKSIVL